MWYYIILIGIACFVLYAFVLYNSFVNLNNKVKEAFSTMDIYLKKRWDLIPNLVETVKGYASHEQNTFQEVIHLRNDVYDTMSDDKKMKTNESLTKEISKIMLLAESYPELKADKTFRDLSIELTKAEEDIANARKYYNGVIRIYNNKVEMFPNNIFAKLYGYKVKAMFLANEEERNNVKVNLE